LENEEAERMEREKTSGKQVTILQKKLDRVCYNKEISLGMK